MDRGSPVRATFLLADFGSAESTGKVNIMGGGWTTTVANIPGAMSVSGVIHIDWDAANQRHTMRVELVDGNGRAVVVPTPMGEQPFQINAEFEAGRPPGMPRGSALGLPIAINFVRPPLQVGAYSFEVFINGSPAAHLPFSVLPPPAQIVSGLPGGRA